MYTVARVDVAAPRRYSHPDDSTPQLPGRRSAAYDGAGFTAANGVPIIGNFPIGAFAIVPFGTFL